MTRYLKDMKVVDVYRKADAVEFVIYHPNGYCHVLRGRRLEPPALARFSFCDGDWIAYCPVDEEFVHPGLALTAAYECAREFVMLFGEPDLNRLPESSPYISRRPLLTEMAGRLAATG